MIMKLKMCTTGKMFCEICLKTIRDHFFPIWGPQSRKGWGEPWKNRGGLNLLVGSDIQKEAEAQNFGHDLRENSSVSPLVSNPGPP